MTRTRRTEIDSTTPGGLQEGGIRSLLGYQLAQATILTSGVFDRTVGEPLALKPVEFTILQLVHENPGVTVTKVAKALAVTTPGITIWVDRLEARGLLRRERGGVDRRTQHLVVTPEGEALVVNALAQLLQAEQALLMVLSDGERCILLELLHKVSRTRTA